MCESSERTACVVLIESPLAVWQGYGEWSLCEGPDDEAWILEAIQFGLLAALRKQVRPGDGCNVTICLTNFRPRPLLRELLKYDNLKQLVEENEEQFAWSQIHKHPLERGDE